MSVSQLRFAVPSADVLTQLIEAPLPRGLKGSAATRTFHRDLYFDTPEGTLRRLRITCRLRIGIDDSRLLMVRIEGGSAPGAAPAGEFVARVAEQDPRAALAGATDPARRLQAVIDPGRLERVLDLTTERHRRRGRGSWLPLGSVIFLYDAVAVRQHELEGAFHELVVQRRGRPGVTLIELASALEDRYNLRPTLTDRRLRAELALESLESERLARDVQARRLVTVLAVERGRIALTTEGTDLRLPMRSGSGEHACRSVLRATLGSAEGQVVLMGVVAATATRPAVEVWLARRLRRDVTSDGHPGLQWLHPGEVVSRVGSPVLRDPTTLAALGLAARSDLVPEWSAAPPEPVGHGAAGGVGEQRSSETLSGLRAPVLHDAALDTASRSPEQFVNQELSWLEFNARVLALAEDPGTPLLARIRFLAIVSTNLDEFFSVRVAGLKQAAARGITQPSLDGLSPQEQLDAITIRVQALVARQERCLRELVDRALPTHEIRIRCWAELSDDERGRLREHFDREIFPIVTPKAITWAPGHPFPFIEDLRLSLAVTIRDDQTGTRHFGYLRIPSVLPRFIAVDATHDFVPVEDVVRANIASFYAGRTVLEAHAFRLTRRGELDLDEPAAADFVQAVEEELRRRPAAPVVRIEMERSMSRGVRDVLRKELRFEEAEDSPSLGEPDVYEAETLVNLGDLTEIADLPLAELQYPPFTPAHRFPEDRSVFALLDERDRLVHHPYDAFESTFERFIVEAVEDPDVLAIKLTLYRPGGPSAIGDALRRAAQAGKDVSVFVELKARFDEERNIRWARELEREGIHVVTGLVRLKTHAKIALVVRRAGGSVRRYAQIGTGNYNSHTACRYSDLGLYTTDASISSDVASLFNELTGSSRPPQADCAALLVSPTNMLPRFHRLIDREIAHAQAGRTGRIRAKLNALADAEIIEALYRASQAGVYVDLVVRGICMLRPGIPGLSERIRVVSIVGRFLEHARVFHFENAGRPEYYLGSADWRPRNLRRRVEVVTPVKDAAAAARLAAILDAELDDPFAWELRSDGTYVRVTAPTGVELMGAQERFMAEAAGAP